MFWFINAHTRFVLRRKESLALLSFVCKMVAARFAPCRASVGLKVNRCGHRLVGNRVNRVRVGCAAPASLAETAIEVETKELLQINKDNFFEYVKDANNGLVVVDFYTDWCGPCKMIYPSLVELNEQYGDAVNIVKFNCNAYNKELGKELKIKVAPTFHIYKAGDKVAEMSGANVERLKELIENSK